MSTGKGIVAITYQVFGEQPRGDSNFSGLGHSPADSLIRKLCASCHLDHGKTAHRLDSPRRGGGCLGCHINSYPQAAHPRLTTQITDQRCFGCHSRSARVSLNYRGLAEVEASDWQNAGASSLLRLDDLRLVERKESDLHQRAGMGCIDCHTGPGLMGSAEGLRNAREAVDIQCTDCHRNARARIRLKNWTQQYAAYKTRLSFPAGAEQLFLTTERKGTPLWHVEVEGERLWLHRKLSGGRVEVPLYRSSSHLLEEEHARLSCEACHSRWAPQCYGCHLEYVPRQRQWDHQLRRPTRGRWREYRWGLESAEPTLGVTAEGRIHPFVPGMILSIEHPQWERPKFHRLFAALSPHTTGKARDCESCHGSSRALGLGAGQLHRCGDGWRFEPERPALQDGLPADAWTTLSGVSVGESIRVGDRSLSKQEILRVLDAELTPEAPSDKTAGLADGVEVELEYQDGVRSALVPLKVTPGTRPELVFLPHGWGQQAAALRIADDRGASDNRLMTRLAEDPETGAMGLRVNFVRLVVDGQRLESPAPEALGIAPEPRSEPMPQPCTESDEQEEEAGAPHEEPEGEEEWPEWIEEGC